MRDEMLKIRFRFMLFFKKCVCLLLNPHYNFDGPAVLVGELSKHKQTQIVERTCESSIDGNDRHDNLNNCAIISALIIKFE